MANFRTMAINIQVENGASFSAGEYGGAKSKQVKTIMM